MNKFLIVDGSSVFYRAFYAMPRLTTAKGEPTGALTGFANIILKILREYSPDMAAVALDVAKKTFRNEIFPEYKATRHAMPDELAAQFPLLKEFMATLGIKTCAAQGYEADDIIGTLAAQASKNFLVDIFTGDRDALQLINENTRVLLNRKKDIEVYDAEKFQAEYGFAPPLLVDFKGLNGDESDNIPGVLGIGEKTAKTLIKQFGVLENVLEHRADIKNKKIRDALENGIDAAHLSKKLAQIVRNVPEIIFDADEFKIAPDLDRVDEFCRRYALNVARKKIYELFGAENLFTTPNPFPTLKPLNLDDLNAAAGVSIATLDMNNFVVKIFGGKVFAATRDDVQKIFDDFNGQIILNGLKNYLHVFKASNLEKFFDMELAAYLIYPEREKMSREDDLRIGKDLALTVKTFEKLAPQYEKVLTDNDLMKLYREMELPLTEILARMEMRGVFVDRKRLKEKAAEMSERLAVLEKNIHDLAGETFNINSPRQLAGFLFVTLKLPPVKKSKTGYSTDIEVLEELKERHPSIPEIIKFRKLTKLKSTYLDGLGKLIGADGRVHTNFNQNIPVRTDDGREIRALFVPGEGYDCILSADYSQIELRLLAHMSGDENLIDAFKNGQDIHARTASEVFDVPIEEVTPELRRKAKAVNFGIIYGMSVFGLAQDLHISRQEAGEYIMRYFERYPGVKEFLDATVAQAHLHGYVMTMFGRRRALYGINSLNFNLRSVAERMAMNTPIQGSAADVIKMAMIRTEENLRGFDSRVIIQVHDELVVETKKSELAEVEKILRESMKLGVAEMTEGRNFHAR